MRVLDREYQGRVRFRTVEHLEAEALEAVAFYGWKSHGAVAWVDGQLRYQAADHRVSMRDVDVRLREVLGMPDDCRRFDR